MNSNRSEYLKRYYQQHKAERQAYFKEYYKKQKLRKDRLENGKYEEERNDIDGETKI